MMMMVIIKKNNGWEEEGREGEREKPVERAAAAENEPAVVGQES